MATPASRAFLACLAAALVTAPAACATPFVDGISDQSLPAWDSGFSESYFARLFSAVWVRSGHVRLARYVVQWDAMGEPANGPDPHGDYRERLEAWLDDVGTLGLLSEVSLTSYDGVRPRSASEYETRVAQILDLARAMGHPVRYVEAWNEPNNQGHETALEAARLTNSASALCAEREACSVVAGNLVDSPGAVSYERQYESALHPVPAIWGVHPYYSVELENEAPLQSLIEGLPRGLAGEQLWLTEIAARACTRYGGHLVENGEAGQATRARWLVDTLMRDRRPDHVFYYAFLLGERHAPSCSGAAEDGALYEPSGDPSAPDTPRAAASYVWGGQPDALTGACGEPLGFAGSARGEPVAWSPADASLGFSIAVLTNGCTTRAGTSTATFIP